MDSERSSGTESEDNVAMSEISETDSQYLKRRQLEKRQRNAAPGSTGTSPNKKKKKKNKSASKPCSAPNTRSKTSAAIKTEIVNVATSNQFAALENVPTEPPKHHETPQISEPLPPPIFVSNVSNFMTFGQEIASLIGPTNFKCYSRVKDIKINTATKENYKKLVNHLTDKKYHFHCYQLKEDKAYRVVLRGLHSTTPTDAIKRDLEEIGHNVRNISVVLHPVEKFPLPLFFVDLEPARSNIEIFDITRLVYSVVRFEEPRQRPTIVQCTRCQALGHTKAYCHYPARCVKCAGAHATDTCRKTRETPAKCVLCGEDHPANYKGCVVHKNLQRVRSHHAASKSQYENSKEEIEKLHENQHHNNQQQPLTSTDNNPPQQGQRTFSAISRKQQPRHQQIRQQAPQTSQSQPMVPKSHPPLLPPRQDIPSHRLPLRVKLPPQSEPTTPSQTYSMKNLQTQKPLKVDAASSVLRRVQLPTSFPRHTNPPPQPSEQYPVPDQRPQKSEATIPPAVEGSPLPEPHFITKPGNFSVVRGDTVRLPCHAVNTGSYIQAWKRDIAVLTAGKVKVTPDARIRLVGDDYDLEIQKLNINDTGEYVCQVAAYQPVEITHSLLVKVPPVIEQVTSGGLVEVKKGTKILLECKSSGIPPPTITWTRKNNLVVAGAKSITGSSLTINQTTRHHAGVYMCTADNGVPLPVTKEITVNILYAPEIEVERVWVHTGIGFEAQLVCIVHAHPPADVRWYTDSMRLENTEKMRMENRGSRHSLIIRDVEETDFTNYTCQADNSQGKTKEHIVLSGAPHPVVFRSQSTSQARDSFNISWSVNSYSPIEIYRLYYKKALSGGDLDPSPPTKKAPKKYNQWPSSLTHKEWTEVIVPGDKKEKSQIHEGHFLIRRLEPKTEYEAKAQAKNRFGWSTITDTFKFKTKGMDGIALDLTPEPAYQNSQESPSPRHLEATAGCVQIHLLYRTWMCSMLFLLLAII